MKAALLVRPRDLRLASRDVPPLGPGDVLVRISIAGLCGTDYRIWTGERPVAYPRIMGHELVGRVQATGADVTRVRRGDRVVVEPNYSCGRCALCLEGNRNLCLSRTAVGIDVDGGFAELARVPERCCWTVASDTPDDTLVLAEPLAVVVRAVDRGAPRRGEHVAVLGAGTLGLLALQVLVGLGVGVLVVARSSRRFALARSLGAAATHAVADGAVSEAARAFSMREGVDLVVETAGTPEAVEHALALVRPGGRVVLTGLPREATPVSFFSVVRREVTIRGSMIYQDEFPKAVRLLESGLVQSAPLVTHRFALEAIADAFAAHRDPASIKVAVVPGDDVSGTTSG